MKRIDHTNIPGVTFVGPFANIKRKSTRVGGERVVKADTRIIVASSTDLEKLVLEGRFLRDLLHRLNAGGQVTRPVRPPIFQTAGTC